MHLAAREIEADVVVGEHARELLHDPAHLENGLGALMPRGFYGARERPRKAKGGLAPALRSSRDLSLAGYEQSAACTCRR